MTSACDTRVSCVSAVVALSVAFLTRALRSSTMAVRRITSALLVSLASKGLRSCWGMATGFSTGISLGRFRGVLLPWEMG